MMKQIKEWYRSCRNLDTVDNLKQTNITTTENLEKAKEKIGDLEKELSKTKKRNINSINMFGHEIANHLNLIVGYPGLIKETLPKDTDIYSHIEAIEKAGEKLLSTIDILKLATKDEFYGRYQHFPTEILNEETRLQIDYLKKQKIKLSNIQPKEQIITTLDPGALKFLFFTSIGNSLSWTPSGTEIKSEMKIKGNDLIYRIENEFAKKRNQNYEHGTSEGIGTSMTKKIIEEIGGKMEIYSKPRIIQNGSTEEFGYTGSVDNNSEKIYGLELTIPLQAQNGKDLTSKI